MKKDIVVFKGAFTLAFGTFLAKLIGALYRIPLTNYLGSYGLGLYQMVFPIYTLLLDFSGAGTPNAISKVISSFDGDNKENYSYNILISSKKLLLKFGLIFSSILALLSYYIAIAQGNRDCFVAYIFLSPSILLVCLISSYRGYFQGLMNMKPTSISQIFEQIFKLIFGLIFTYLFRNNVVLAVAGATFAITLSELIALIYLYYVFLCNKKRYSILLNFDKHLSSKNTKSLIKIMIPVTLIGITMPLSHVIDSFMIVNILSKYNDNATSLYGILTGVVGTIINLPVALCYGIACVTVPAVSREKNEKKQNRMSIKVLCFTLIFSIPFILAFIFFPNIVISVLFRKLTESDKSIAISLLKMMSINVFLISMLQTQNAVLIGMGKIYCPLISMTLSIVAKILINYFLLNNTSFGIYGGAIGLISCYFLADLINLFMIFVLKVKNANKIVRHRELQNQE